MQIPICRDPLKPAEKIGGAFAAAAHIYDGADTAIPGILNHMLLYGIKAYSGGSAFGKPIIQYGPAGISGDIENYDDLFREFGRRFARG